MTLLRKHSPIASSAKLNLSDRRLQAEDVHEPIIDRETWEIIQSHRGRSSTRKPKEVEKNIFSGLLYCADCGSKLHFKRYSSSGLEYFLDGNCRMNEKAMLYIDKKVKSLSARISVIDALIMILYEDNINGKINDEMFTIMSEKFLKEKHEKEAESIKLNNSKKTKKSARSKVIKYVREHMETGKMTPAMVKELISSIDVCNTEGTGKNRTQSIYQLPFHGETSKRNVS